MSRPNSTTSAWAIFRHQDRGEPWTRADRIARELSVIHGSARVHLARELSSLQSDLSNDERLASELLFLAMMVDVDNGSTRMSARSQTLAQHFGRLFTGSNEIDHAVDHSALAKIAAGLIDNQRLHHVIGDTPNSHQLFIHRAGWLHEGRLLRRECQLARSINDRIVRQAEQDQSISIESTHQFGLTAEQESAVLSALNAPLTLVSGGPGTGKTSIIVAIIVGAVQNGLSPDQIMLAAPTGKAAWRMGESIRAGLQSSAAELQEACLTEDPKTLHRLLGYVPSHGRFKHHHGDPLNAELIIVDEASMIDTVLMERLFAAAPTQARLVLLGDAQQLPSVRAGAVFRNLTSTCQDQCVTLTKNFRMRPDDPDGSDILRVAEAIKSGQPLRVDDLATSTRIDDLQWRGVESLNLTEERLDRFADRWYERTVHNVQALDETSLEDAFRVMESSRLLCITRNGFDGVIRWNERLHSRRARQFGVSAQEQFISGEPVIMLRNDYGRGLFNGDQGLVVDRVLEGVPSRWIAFRSLDGFRFFLLDGLRDQLEHCYAMTIHKSQGSEFEYVAVQLPDRDSGILTRELVYTGVTRSRRSVVFLGTAARLNDAIERPVARSSALDELILAGDSTGNSEGKRS